MRQGSKMLFASFFLVTGMFVARLPATIAYTRTWLGSPADGDVNWSVAFTDVLGIIRERYVETPKEDELLKGAINGMTEALNDPYTEFIAPSDRAAFEKDLTGHFVGIGASVNIRDNWLTIAYPLEGSPAYRAGLLPGDQVRAIEGKSTEGLAVDACVKMLLGEPNTPVKLTVLREGKPEAFEVEIKRAPIAAKTVKGFRFDSMAEDWDYKIDPERGIAYIRVDQFTPTVAEEFRGALLHVARGCKGIIVDLRDNPGGLLDQAIDIADMFLDTGTIVSTKGRNGDGELYEARKGSIGDVPLAILVNQGSASASEIVSGALSDNGRATIIGSRTFGKGLVQRVERLEHVPGAQLKITEQHYYLPSGRMIQRTDKATTWGVDPGEGFYVPLTDEQQRKVWAIKRGMETIRPPVMVGEKRLPAPAPAKDKEMAEKVSGPDARWSDPAWISEKIEDPQLAAALKAMQLRVQDGKWTPTGQANPDQPKAIATAELTRLEKERERMERFLDRLDQRIEAVGGGKVSAEARRNADLWTDQADLTGGKLQVFDKDGRLVAWLDITGPDVERWLLDADVKPHPTEGKPAEKSAGSEEKPKN